MLTAEWSNLAPNVAARRVGEDYEFLLRPAVTEEDTILVVLSRIRERAGDPRADITAWWGLNGKIPPRSLPLFQDQVWLNAGRDRERLAGRLARFVKKSAPWGEWAEAICFAAKQDWERGEPVIPLADVAAPSAVSYLVYPLLLEGETTLLYGDGESGKSVIALAAALAVAAGVELPGMQLRGAPAPVLYLDWETSATIAARRLALLSSGFGITPPAHIYYRRMARALADDLRMLRAEADRCGAAFIVIDSLGPACGGSPSKEELVIPFFNAVRSLNRTVLITSHISKMEAGMDGDKATPIGSIYARNLSRQTWLARRAEKTEGSPVVFVALFHTKGNESTRFAPMGICLEFSPQAIRLSKTAPGDVPALAVHLPMASRVRAVLAHGARTAAEIAEQLDVAESTVRGVLNRMEDAVVIQPGGPRKPSLWGLRARGDGEGVTTAADR